MIAANGAFPVNYAKGVVYMSLDRAGSKQISGMFDLKPVRRFIHLTCEFEASLQHLPDHDD